MFAGKVAIVTGAATGLGETIAEILFQRGASVTLVDIDRDGARNVAARLDPAGARRAPAPQARRGSRPIARPSTASSG